MTFEENVPGLANVFKKKKKKNAVSVQPQRAIKAESTKTIIFFQLYLYTFEPQMLGCDARL